MPNNKMRRGKQVTIHILNQKYRLSHENEFIFLVVDFTKMDKMYESFDKFTLLYINCNAFEEVLLIVIIQA